MNVLGYELDIVRYGESPVLSVYVPLGPGDCLRQKDPSYECIHNCDGKLAVVRFVGDEVVSMKAIAREEFRVDDAVAEQHAVRNLDDLKRVGALDGYSIQDENKAQVLYRGEQEVGIYVPCGVRREQELWTDPALTMIVELSAMTETLFRNARDVGVSGILSDPAVMRGINNPLLEQLMGQEAGEGGLDFLEMVRRLRDRLN